MGEVARALRRLEAATGRSFGGVERPLLVSVRSGAAVSMPGMMDTILNLGLDRALRLRDRAGAGRPAFRHRHWLRFWRMFIDTVLNLDPTELDRGGARHGAEGASGLPRETFRGARESGSLACRRARRDASSADPMEQLELAIAAVFRSWDSPRARAYRQHHGISDDLGTAVTVQSMVFGNADANSGSGVAFTRNPNDGTKVPLRRISDRQAGRGPGRRHA